MEIIGHRGSAGTAPENTLLGVKLALEAGAPWLEIDVRLAANELFVIHDEDVARTTSGSGSIYSKTRDEIAQLDAGAGQTVPTLAEVLDTIDADAALNIELKDTACLQPTLYLVNTFLEENPAWHQRIMLSSFEQSIHQSMARDLPRGCLLGVLLKKVSADAVRYADDLGAFSLNLSIQQVDAAIVSDAHQCGLKVFVYTVNEESDIDACLNFGVDAIYTDFPARALRLVDTKTRSVSNA